MSNSLTAEVEMPFEQKLLLMVTEKAVLTIQEEMSRKLSEESESLNDLLDELKKMLPEETLDNMTLVDHQWEYDLEDSGKLIMILQMKNGLIEFWCDDMDLHIQRKDHRESLTSFLSLFPREMELFKIVAQMNRPSDVLTVLKRLENVGRALKKYQSK